MALNFEATKKQANAKAQKRAQERMARKVERKAANKKKAPRRQIVVRYAEDGTKIGDDGYLMTAARNRLHQTYNVVFVWMVVTFLAAAVCIIQSFFQNQTITDWELVWIGGNMFNGFTVAGLLRVEALFLLFLTALCLFTNMKGMAWMYDGADKKPVQITFLLMLIPSAVYFVAVLLLVGIPEPASVVTMILALLIYKFVPAVEAERPTLKKVPVARTVIKK